MQKFLFNFNYRYTETPIPVDYMPWTDLTPHLKFLGPDILQLDQFKFQLILDRAVKSISKTLSNTKYEMTKKSSLTLFIDSLS